MGWRENSRMLQINKFHCNAYLLCNFAETDDIFPRAFYWFFNSNLIKLSVYWEFNRRAISTWNSPRLFPENLLITIRNYGRTRRRQKRNLSARSWFFSQCNFVLQSERARLYGVWVSLTLRTPISSIFANEDKSRFPRAKCRRRRDLQIEFHASGMRAPRRWVAVWNVTRLIECNASRGSGDWDDWGRRRWYERAWRGTGGRGRMGRIRVIAECAERARRSRFSFDIRGWFRGTHPGVPSNNRVSFVDGKEDIAVERQSTGNDRCVYWLKRFPTLFEPCCRSRDLYSRPRARARSRSRY